jgi:hypothetical protein
MKKFSKDQLKKQQDFINELVFMADKAFRVELYRTGHAMTEATHIAGFELADNLLPHVIRKKKK